MRFLTFPFFESIVNDTVLDHWGWGMMIFKHVLGSFAVALFLLPVSALPVEARGTLTPSHLKWPDHNASGQGHVTTLGSISPPGPSDPVDAPSELFVASTNTWKPGQGIRVRHAGAWAHVSGAEPGEAEWGNVHPEATATPDVNDEAGEDDVKEGSRSIECSLPISSSAPLPVDLCGVDLSPSISFEKDELLVWLKSSAAITRGQLQIMLFRTVDGTLRRVSFGEMEVPAQSAGTWTRAGIRVEGAGGLAITRIELRCNSGCAGLSVHLDDLIVVNDLFGRVGQVFASRTGPKKLTVVKKDGTTPQPALRQVTNELVFHDDTIALEKWLAVGRTTPGELFAANGVYYVNSVQVTDWPHLESMSLTIPNNVTMRCQSSTKTTFKSTGGSQTGSSKMFRAHEPSPTNITVQSCGFDANGWNLDDFFTVLNLNAGGEPDLSPKGENIRVLNNRFFDSDPPGELGCDNDQDKCATRQRQYIVVQGAVGVENPPGVMVRPGVIVEGNELRNGGRIKTGGHDLSSWNFIRNNTVDFINDNGITIVQRGGVTRNVEITNNTVRNAVGTAIFFASDGEGHGSIPGMTTRDILIKDNIVSGYFHSGIKGILGEIAERITVEGNRILADRPQPAVTGVTSVGIMVKRGRAECSDGSDNDEDEEIDFGNDPECASALDNSEGSTDTTTWMPDPSSEIRILGNRVLSSGTFSNFKEMAVLIDGPLRDVAFNGNIISCVEQFPVPPTEPIPCPGAVSERALRFRIGPLESIEVANNVIADAGIGLLMGNLNSQPANDVFIHDNSFLRARSSANDAGQLMFQSPPTSVIEATVASNLFKDPVDIEMWGIMCVPPSKGGGTYTMTIPPSNTFVGHTNQTSTTCL